MEKQVEQWNLIELFGHSRIAGRVTVEDGEIRVDVPAVCGLQGFTKYFNKSAIYSRVVVDEETAVAVASNLKIQPVSVWSARQMLALENEKYTDTEQDPVRRFEEGYDSDAIEDEEDVNFYGDLWNSEKNHCITN